MQKVALFPIKPSQYGHQSININIPIKSIIKCGIIFFTQVKCLAYLKAENFFINDIIYTWESRFIRQT